MLKISVNCRKGVGTIYHYVKKASTFFLICSDLKLRAGSKEETGPAHSKKEPFVSFTRDKNLIRTASNRYRMGFIIDGDILSDRYKIEPISYTNYQMSGKNDDIRMMRLTRYTNGVCKLYLIGLGSIDISERVYDAISTIIENLSEDIKRKKNLSIKEGGKKKVPGVGATIEKQYFFNTKNGLILNTDKYPKLADVIPNIGSTSRLSESEERVWNDQVDIQKALRGVIIPRDLTEGEGYYVKEGMGFLKAQGIDILPDGCDIGYKSSGSFIIERI